MKRPLPLVEIEWIDSHSFSGSAWCLMEDVEGHKLSATNTSGFVIEENGVSITVASSVHFDDGKLFEVGGAITIPKFAIVRRRDHK